VLVRVLVVAVILGILGLVATHVGGYSGTKFAILVSFSLPLGLLLGWLEERRGRRRRM